MHEYPSQLGMALSNGVNVIDEDTLLDIRQYSDDNLSSICEKIAEKKFKRETMLLVTDKDGIMGRDSFKSFSHREFVDYLKPTQCEIKGTYSFTGVQYNAVVVILRRFFEEEKDTKVSNDLKDEKVKDFKDHFRLNIVPLLYQTISRALNRVIVVCHESNLQVIQDLFALTFKASDFNLFDKLREKEVIPKENFLSLKSEQELYDVFWIVVVTKNCTQFKIVKDLIKNLPSEFVFEALVRYIPWGENGEILDMLDDFSTDDYKSSLQLPKFLVPFLKSTNLLSRLPDVVLRRENLLDRIKGIVKIDMDDVIKGVDRYEYVLYDLVVSSLAWNYKELFWVALEKLNSTIVAFSRFFIDLSVKMSHDMRELFMCTQLSADQIFPRKKAEIFFQKYSAAFETAPKTMIYSRDETWENFWKTLYENHPIDLMFRYQSKAFQNIFKLIFKKCIEQTFVYIPGGNSTYLSLSVPRRDLMKEMTQKEFELLVWLEENSVKHQDESNGRLQTTIAKLLRLIKADVAMTLKI